MAIAYINSDLGIPKSEDSTTRTYCELKECVGGYFISHDETVESILQSEPIDITLIEKDNV
jgi:hypothetical protein